MRADASAPAKSAAVAGLRLALLALGMDAPDSCSGAHHSTLSPETLDPRNLSKTLQPWRSLLQRAARSGTLHVRPQSAAHACEGVPGSGVASLLALGEACLAWSSASFHTALCGVAATAAITAGSGMRGRGILLFLTGPQRECRDGRAVSEPYHWLHTGTARGCARHQRVRAPAR